MWNLRLVITPLIVLIIGLEAAELHTKTGHLMSSVSKKNFTVASSSGATFEPRGDIGGGGGGGGGYGSSGGSGYSIGGGGGGGGGGQGWGSGGGMAQPSVYQYTHYPSAMMGGYGGGAGGAQGWGSGYDEDDDDDSLGPELIGLLGLKGLKGLKGIKAVKAIKAVKKAGLLALSPILFPLLLPLLFLPLLLLLLPLLLLLFIPIPIITTGRRRRDADTGAPVISTEFLKATLDDLMSRIPADLTKLDFLKNLQQPQQQR